MYVQTDHMSLIFVKINFLLCNVLFNIDDMQGIHEKGYGDVVSAVSYTIYTIYLPLCTKQLRRHLICSLRDFPCIMYIIVYIEVKMQSFVLN